MVKLSRYFNEIDYHNKYKESVYPWKRYELFVVIGYGYVLQLIF